MKYNIILYSLIYDSIIVVNSYRKQTNSKWYIVLYAFVNSRYSYTQSYKYYSHIDIINYISIKTL